MNPSPLYNVEAEYMVIGSFLQDRSTHKHIGTLTASDFSDPYLQSAFVAIQSIYQRRQLVDLVTVDAQIQRDKGEGFNNNYLVACTDACMKALTTANIKSHIKLVRECAERRNLCNAAYKLQEMAMDATVDIEEAVAQTRAIVKTGSTEEDGWSSVTDVLVKTYERIEGTMSGKYTPVTTGIQQLDSVFYGFVPGELTVVGARPGVGKSAFALSVAINAASLGKRVAIASLEMSMEQYGQRILANQTGIDSQKIRRADLTQENLQHILEVIRAVDPSRLVFEFEYNTIEHLCAAVTRKKEDQGLDLLIIDYMQLLRTRRNVKSDYERVTYISQMLKSLAMQAKIPVVALAQLSRSFSQRQDRRPILSDLRDSGSIEQDADNVIFLHRPEEADDKGVHPLDAPKFYKYLDEGYHYIHIAVAKQRQGQVGAGNLLFEPRVMKYRGIPRGREQ